jgi:hypothetical protein
VHGAHRALALQLNPDAVDARAREHHLEFHLRTAVGEQRVLVHHVDEIIARDQHVRPCAEILLESSFGGDRQPHLRAGGRNWLFGNR